MSRAEPGIHELAAGSGTAADGVPSTASASAGPEELTADELASMMIAAEKVVIAGLVPRALMDAFQRAGEQRLDEGASAPRITYLTPQSKLVWNDSPLSMHAKVAWHQSVVGISNLIGALTHRGANPRVRELVDAVKEAPMRLAACIVAITGQRQRTFAAIGAPEDYADDAGEAVTIAQLSARDAARFDGWFDYLEDRANPVRMWEVACAPVGGKPRHSEDAPPFVIESLVRFGDRRARAGTLTPRAAVIARVTGPSVLLMRRTEAANADGAGLLSILTQRIQDIDLPGSVSSPSATRPRIERIRTRMGLGFEEPLVIPPEAYLRAAAREVELTFGIPASEVIREERLVFRGHAVVEEKDPDEINGFAVFTFDVRCDDEVDELDPALTLNKPRLEQITQAALERERTAQTANNLLSRHADWIDELCFTTPQK